MVCLDACDFQFPADPLVVYLFNPFSEPVFVKVLENLRSQWSKHRGWFILLIDIRSMKSC